MELIPTSRYERRYKKLTTEQRAAVDAALEGFLRDPFDPRLRTHKLSGPLAARWSVSAQLDLRILLRWEGARVYLLLVGTHGEVY